MYKKLLFILTALLVLTGSYMVFFYGPVPVSVSVSSGTKVSGVKIEPPTGSEFNAPALIKISDQYRVYFTEKNRTKLIIRSATSPDGLNWNLEEGVRLRGGSPSVLETQGGFRMYYAQNGSIFSATSTDGLNWKPEEGVRLRGDSPSVLETQGGFRMYYAQNGSIFSATSTDGLNWKPEEGVRIRPSEGYYDSRGVFGPEAVVLPDGYIRIYYTGFDGEVYRVLSASSPDGLKFRKEKGVVLELSQAGEVGVVETAPEVYSMFYSENGVIRRADSTFQSPRDYKIFYFHVPIAITSYLAFTFVFISGIFYLRGGGRRWDIRAVSAAEVGVIFAGLALLSGSMWAKSAWGAFWVEWDVRLNTTLVLFLIYLAYLMVRNAVEEPEKRARLSAVFGIVGFAGVPLSYFSIIIAQKSTLHPKVFGPGGGGIAGEAIITTLLVNLAAYILLAVSLILTRIQEEELKDILWEVKSGS